MENKFLPQKNNKIIITLRIDSELINKLDAIAFNIDISRNQLILQCIHFALTNFIHFNKNSGI